MNYELAINVHTMVHVICYTLDLHQKVPQNGGRTINLRPLWNEKSVASEEFDLAISG